ncbi:EXLDI protein [Nocardia sp. BMG111209]|uniref:EXLDI protein n=1 Tax=Nocardia sp. BMG111209 TaxID=1160137 RepID=UPI0003772A96|nr:EXLDI protein [Nocardia sp. BMG111209]
MPNKTVYVKDEDLPLFDRAQELVGGNLSGAILAALRRFIELEEGRMAGFEEVVLRVGHDGVRQIRFSGRLLAELRDLNGAKLEQYRVFRTRKGKLALHTQHSDWKDYPTDANWLKDLTNWRKMLGIAPMEEWGDFDMQVFDSLDDLRDHIPAKLYRRVADLESHPHIEDLDI